MDLGLPVFLMVAIVAVGGFWGYVLWLAGPRWEDDAGRVLPHDRPVDTPSPPFDPKTTRERWAQRKP